MTRLWIRALVLALALAGVSASQVWVDHENAGLLLGERPADEQRIAEWPTGLRQCVESVDAQYIEHADRYQVDDWLFTERSYGDRGAIATRITINDLQAMTTEAHKQGVWKHPRDCAEINTQLYLHVLNPIAGLVGTQNRKSMSAHAHGIVVDLMCRQSHADSYTVCTAELWAQITHSKPQKRGSARHSTL